MQNTATLNLMDFYNKSSSTLSIVLWPLTIMILGIKNIVAKITLNQNTFTFILGSIVSILAATHYVIQIIKSIKRKKDENADN